MKTCFVVEFRSYPAVFSGRRPARSPSTVDIARLALSCQSLSDYTGINGSSSHARQLLHLELIAAMLSTIVDIIA